MRKMGWGCAPLERFLENRTPCGTKLTIFFAVTNTASLMLSTWFYGVLALLSILSIAECFQPQFLLRSSFGIKYSGRSNALAGRIHYLEPRKQRGMRISAVIEGVDQLNTILNSFDSSSMAWIQHASFLLSDAVAAVDPVAASDAAAVADAAATAAKASSPGLYDSFVNVIEQSLVLLHSGLKTAGVPGAWGMSIILFTLLVKAVTYPLNYKQMASTFQMQALQPKLKAIQSRFQGDPQKINEMTAKLYQDEKINPFSGCLPTLVQIPVFIALYRSLLDLAKKDILNEGFLWIPSLEGPVGQYSPTTGLPIDGTAWIFKNWVDGHPSMGWPDTLAYLSVPIILVITQSVSQRLLQPQTEDPQQQQTQQILKFLPLMIGWFSLNVPAGLGVYWVVNNIVSSAQQWFIRQQVKPATATVGPSDENGNLREVYKEMTSSKLRSAEELKFKVAKKAEVPVVAETTAASIKPEATASVEDEGTKGAAEEAESAAESKSAMKKKAKAKSKK